MKNPQTTIAPTFLTNIISAIGGVREFLPNNLKKCNLVRFEFLSQNDQIIHETLKVFIQYEKRYWYV